MKKRLRTMTGTVVSDKMDKTIVVKVVRTTRHPIYKRVIRRKKKYKAHDEENKAKMGNKVKIAMTRPLSKTKCWRLVEVVK
ncbi:MAG: 30S ribosomal protein S17 [Candidatus Omnitrophica bacterium]|nr:30S ribosomal protein S17 [Candidatus Omnitrophota bacterium]